MIMTYPILPECARHGGGILEESRVAVRSYDFRNGGLQGRDELPVPGEITYGSDLRTLAKYLVMKAM